MDECLRQATALANMQRRRAARRSTFRVSTGAGGPPNGVANGGSTNGSTSHDREAKEAMLRRGLPSWVHMPSLGIPRIESRDLGGLTPSASRSAIAREHFLLSVPAWSGCPACWAWPADSNVLDV
jgi:hypothetical protein